MGVRHWLRVGHGRAPLVSSGLSSASIRTALILGTVAGSIFGLVFPVLWRARIGKLVSRVQALDPRIVGPVPEGRYSVYVPCNHLISQRLAYGGVLYAGLDGLCFQPHRYLQPRSLQALQIPPCGLTLALSTVSVSAWRRLLVPRDPEIVHASWNGGEASFLVPKPGDVMPRLKHAIES